MEGVEKCARDEVLRPDHGRGVHKQPAAESSEPEPCQLCRENQGEVEPSIEIR